MSEWSKERAWKVRKVQKAFGGSNPFLSAENKVANSNYPGLTTLFF